MATATTPEKPPANKYIAIDRRQLSWEEMDIEQLIPADHSARLIWNVVGNLDLTAFEQANQSKEGGSGRPGWPPQLLISIWTYCYSIGVASARAIERMMAHEPALRWLTGNQTVNHHTLSDFRVEHKEALDKLFVEFLALLDKEGLVDLSTILHDGTKVRTVAGNTSLKRRKPLEQRLRKARKVLRELDRRAEQDSEAMETKRQAAQQRAARERVERIQAALVKMQQIEATVPAGEREKVRVSESEPEARKMKHPDNGWAPSYNVQVSTEAQSRIIVAIEATASQNDTNELMPAMERVEQNCGAAPKTVIADNGYATRSNVEETAKKDIDLVAPWKSDEARAAGPCRLHGIDPKFAGSTFVPVRGGKALQCPAGKTLVVIQQRQDHSLLKNVFAASEQDCANCAFRAQCCGDKPGPRRVERVKESKAMRRYLARMKRRATKALYKKRAEIAEFPHMWAKGTKKWRRFSVRGLVKATTEALWVALAYNFTQYIRLRSQTEPTDATA